ncbi:hypothetical protein ASPVEDRAFT_251205 [Aspergillus versicolor CBS 583.65]|uniref:Uncharacterized protein n=1 Tax=Aspergillus versicolor CBS 583.65 TaxID=1036611 RepID=A0A1L9P5E6_ASPVE|nr:uncharacterized protein ASPVEDRAFT_251205 [Aspergillus versicolor CBS 583.65]OJI96716.1 hypothetical protein ASPVEDRAFT_251205 [Aspergillus versicolor CBS 583.65]
MRVDTCAAIAAANSVIVAQVPGLGASICNRGILSASALVSRPCLRPFFSPAVLVRYSCRLHQLFAHHTPSGYGRITR